MYSSVPTKLPLATFGQIMGINPLHIAQVYFKPTTSGKPRSNCAVVLPQYGWQDADAVSRDEISRAIAEAEENIERELGYRLLPSWETDEWQDTIRPYRADLFNLSVTDLRGYAQHVKGRWGWAVSGGIKALTVLAAATAITYTDANADGYDETATATAAVGAGVSACEVRAFYPGKAGAPEWEIRPVSVTIAGGVATIVFRREQAVLEALQEEFEPTEVQGDVDASFLGTVDIYRVYNDPSTQATFLWNNRPGVCDCGDSTCATCDYSTQTGCLSIRGDPRSSNLTYQPGTWVPADATFTSEAWAVGRQPDIVRLYYYAGLRDKGLACPTREMDRAWQQAVAKYAAALLDRPPCGCVRENWEGWREDLAFSSGATELASYQLSPKDLENPFGTRRGMIEAFRRVKQEGQANARVAFVP